MTEIEKAYDLEWEIERHDIFIQEPLGKGAFGKVLKALAFGSKVPTPGPVTVAVKMLKGR